MKNNIDRLLSNTLDCKFLSREELLVLYQQAPLSSLMRAAFVLRNKLTDRDIVTWMIDRNINITNGCVCGCKFCNFHVKPNSNKGYVTTKEEYRRKIDELFAKDGNQILLQGGMNVSLDLNFYIDLFSWFKQEFPSLKIHALGPPEVYFIAKQAKLGVSETLQRLIKAGLDSLPGAGAEILSDRVRSIISPRKCTVEQWMDVMREAHKLNMVTSATMMFGHIETVEERIDHLLLLRNLQEAKPANTFGFTAFIPWTFQSYGTQLRRDFPDMQQISASDYLRLIAISRLALVNIPNIQASWLTVGKNVAQLCLYAGANDLGSIMIEENVVSAAGANYSMNAQEMQDTVSEAGFIPAKRNQDYTLEGC